MNLPSRQRKTELTYLILQGNTQITSLYLKTCKTSGLQHYLDLQSCCLGQYWVYLTGIIKSLIIDSRFNLCMCVPKQSQSVAQLPCTSILGKKKGEPARLIVHQTALQARPCHTCCSDLCHQQWYFYFVRFLVCFQHKCHHILYTPLKCQEGMPI